jgi:4-hydroxybenzoate polyprenyltransferase
MAYAAIQFRLPGECWALFAANLFYAFAYDTEYAMVDREDDARLGLRTAALALGSFDVAAVMASYGAMLAILLALGISLEFGSPYFLGLAAAWGLVAWQWRLIRTRSRDGCFKAFLHSNWIGAAVLAGIIFGS